MRATLKFCREREHCFPKTLPGVGEATPERLALRVLPGDHRGPGLKNQAAGQKEEFG
jgi:hypothetical protein